MVQAPVGTVRFWICLVFVVSRLATNGRTRLRLLLLGMWMPLRDRLPWSVVHRSYRIEMRYGGRNLDWWVGPRSDLEVLNEVLVLEEYRVDERPRTVLDLGSHIGVSVLAFRAAFPDAEIVAVEPDPHSYSRLRRNTAQLNGVRLRRLALTAHDGEAAFAPAAQPWVSALGHGGITVQARTLETLLDELGWDRVDLLKIDIEGAELDVLRSPALDRVGMIVGEIHDDQAIELLGGFEVEISGAEGHRLLRAKARPR